MLHCSKLQLSFLRVLTLSASYLDISISFYYSSSIIQVGECHLPEANVETWGKIDKNEEQNSFQIHGQIFKQHLKFYKPYYIIHNYFYPHIPNHLVVGITPNKSNKTRIIFLVKRDQNMNILQLLRRIFPSDMTQAIPWYFSATLSCLTLICL